MICIRYYILMYIKTFFELQALDKLLHDPKFAEAAKEIGSTLNDQITRPLDRAIWWVEHVMRHPTMYAGKSPVHNLYWHQYFLLDVLTVYAMILYITYQILKFFFFLCFFSDSSRVITLDLSKAKKKTKKMIYTGYFSFLLIYHCFHLLCLITK